MEDFLGQFTPIIAGVGALRLKTLKECDKLFREKDFPFEMDQVQILIVLFHRKGLSQQEIGLRLQRDKASVNRTVSLFSKKGLVKIVPEKEDRRMTRVELTTMGKELAKQTVGILVKYERSLAAVLTEEEYRQFTVLLSKLTVG
ncbi:MAG TPA: MarR family transcriptional regulator [Puia sp.]|nr:MarR family transcriptional regulator [Puia sp.]